MLSTLSTRKATIGLKDIPLGTLFRSQGPNSDPVYLRTQGGAICVYNNGKLMSWRIISIDDFESSGHHLDCIICPTYESITLSNDPETPA